MNKSLKMLVVALSAILLSSSLVQASPYVIGKLGLYVPEDSGLDTGYSLRGAFGLSFRDLGFGGEPRPGSLLDKLKVEAGFGYYTADVDVSGQSGDLTVLPLTVSGVFTHQLPTLPVELRAAIGLGTYFAEIDSTLHDESTVKQGLYLNAGALYNLNEKIGILADVDFDNPSGDFGGWMLNAGMAYRF